jgi:hypothetical protein
MYRHTYYSLVQCQNAEQLNAEQPNAECRPNAEC